MISKLTDPFPKFISFIVVCFTISVLFIFSIPTFIFFTAFVFLNASFIFVYNSCFNGCSSSNPSTQPGKFKFILSTGNSYSIFPNISLTSSMFKFVQSVGITAT